MTQARGGMVGVVVAVMGLVACGSSASVTGSDPISVSEEAGGVEQSQAVVPTEFDGAAGTPELGGTSVVMLVQASLAQPFGG